VLDTTIYKRKDEDKQNKTKIIQRNWQHRIHNKTKTNKTKHNTICVRHHYIQEKRRRPTKQKQSRETGNIGYTTRRRQTKQNTTQYVLDTTIYKRKDGDKQNKNNPEKLAT
jgi:hypothetical protein